MTRARVDHAEAIDELHAELTARIGELTTSDQWLTYLSAASRFHRYSPQNQMLLALQGADGYVASYKNWQRIPAHGGGTCQVAKGERGLTILAPMTSKVVGVDDTTGEETVGRRLRGFRTVKVFDQTQLVDPPDIPEPQLPALLTGENRWQHVWSAVSGHLERDGYSVTLHTRSPIEQWNGRTTWSDRSVLIADTLEPPQRIKTLLHEWAHVQLGHEHRNDITRDLREVEAESVAYLLAQTVGLDTSSYTVPYVVGWSGGDIRIVEAAAEMVLATTKRLVGELESRLGIELAPDILDQSITDDADNVVAMPARPMNVIPFVSRPNRDPVADHEPGRLARQGIDSAAMTDGQFLKAVVNRLEPDDAQRFFDAAFQPERAGEAATMLACAGVSAGQTARVLERFGLNPEQIESALLAPVPDDAEVPTLYSTEEVSAALTNRIASIRSAAITPEPAAESISPSNVIAEQYREGAAPERLAALAYGLGVGHRETIAICIAERSDPTATLAVAVAIHAGNTDAARADLTNVWPDPPGGWETYTQQLATEISVTSTSSTNGIDAYDPTQTILDQWAAMSAAPDFNPLVPSMP